MKYQFTPDYQNKSFEEMWADISIGLREEKPQICSISGKRYELLGVTNIDVVFSLPTRKGGKPETLTKRNFIDSLRIVKENKQFNTNTIKTEFPPELYAMRSPLFAILLAMKIIERK